MRRGAEDLAADLSIVSPQHLHERNTTCLGNSMYCLRLTRLRSTIAHILADAWAQTAAHP